jgi:cytochrome c oxidase subunit 2
MERKRRNILLALAGAALGFAGLKVRALAAPQPSVIKILAKKFDYTPSEIRLKKDIPVVLEFTTEDVVMGFNAPDLGVRTDIVPGKTAQLRIVPDKIGTFPFHCDIFCGSGHEDMAGTIIVTEA